MARRKNSPPPNWASMATSNESMDTSAAVRLTTRAAESTGLLYFRVRTRLITPEMVT